MYFPKNYQIRKKIQASSHKEIFDPSFWSPMTYILVSDTYCALMLYFLKG